MKKICFFLIFFSTDKLSAQNSSYTEYIKTDTSIKWAVSYDSYINLTPTDFEYGNLGDFYREKINAPDIKTYIENGFSVSKKDINHHDFIAAVHHVAFNTAKMNWFFIEDPENSLPGLLQADQNACDTCIDDNYLSFYKVKQLFFYKDHRFHIKNILWSPVIYTKDSGYSKKHPEYFETLNIGCNTKSTDSIPPDAVFISRACNTINLSETGGYEEYEILKSPGIPLSEVLMNDIRDSILQVYDSRISLSPDKKNILEYASFRGYSYNDMTLPIYDSSHTLIGFKKMRNELPYDSMYYFKLIQDFYFDFKHEILYSKLIALIPQVPALNAQGFFEGVKDYGGIIFPERKKLSVKKRIRRF